MVHLKKLILDILGVNSSLNKVYSSFNLDEELSKTNPVAALTSGKITKNDIGKTVYISNSAVACQEWRIADVNHDGTSGTVDLMSRYTLKNTGTCFNSDNSGDRYPYSTIRGWLRTTVYEGFASDIKNVVKTQDVYSYGEILTDKIKCPSLNEFGCPTNLGARVEGNVYPLFKDTVSNTYTEFIKYKTPEGKNTTFWTRTKFEIISVN